MAFTRLQIATAYVMPEVIGIVTSHVSGHFLKVSPRLSAVIGLVGGVAYLVLEIISESLLYKRYKQMKSNGVDKEEAHDIRIRNEHIMKTVLTVFQTIAIGVALKYFSTNSENSGKSFAFLSLVSLGRIGVIINCRGRMHCMYI